MSRRLSTIHDLAALRLHPDCTRVVNETVPNLSLRQARYTAYDVRGNWFARDAGGRIGVRKTRTRGKGKGKAREGEEDEDGEVFDLTGVNGEGDSLVDEGKTDEEDPRARKRRRFAEDLSFLDSPRSSSVAGSLPPSVPEVVLGESHDVPPTHAALSSFSFSTPSSDLLKCIHHFASTYYTAAGQLYDASREARREKRRRRLARAAAGNLADEHDHSDAEEDDEQENENSDSGNEDGDEEGSDTEQEPDDSAHMRWRTHKLLTARKDMYKIFDGSALMVLGMLFQEHIAALLRSTPPAGWEDSAPPRKSRKRKRTAEEEDAPAQNTLKNESKDKTQGKGKPMRGRRSKYEESEAKSSDTDTNGQACGEEDDDRDKRSTEEEQSARPRRSNRTRSCSSAQTGKNSQVPFVDDNEDDEDYVP
ncbi:hypothetical protein BKA93DRAFT_747802 [Sparassis latifolia]